MKSKSTHLRCRQRRPVASNLLPPSITQLAFRCLCTAKARMNTDTLENTCYCRLTSVHKYIHTPVNTSGCWMCRVREGKKFSHGGGVRWRGWLLGDFVCPPSEWTPLAGRSSDGLECSCVCVLCPGMPRWVLSSQCQVSGSYLSLCLQGCRCLDSVYSSWSTRQRGRMGEVRGGSTGFDLMQTVW